MKHEQVMNNFPPASSIPYVLDALQGGNSDTRAWLIINHFTALHERTKSCALLIWQLKYRKSRTEAQNSTKDQVCMYHAFP